MNTTIEKRIASALSSDKTSAADLRSLIDETERAITEADATAALQREKSLDPIASPDASKAHAAMTAAEFARDRLHVILPRLQLQYQEAFVRERQAQWLVEYGEGKTERDDLALEGREFLPEAFARIADYLHRCARLDAKLNELHARRPAGVALHLAGPEATARGIEGFSRDVPSIAAELRLPAFTAGQPPLWPPAAVPIAAVMVTPMAVPGTDADWWKLAEARAREQAADRQRLNAHYSGEQAEREAAGRGNVPCHIISSPRHWRDYRRLHAKNLRRWKFCSLTATHVPPKWMRG